MINRQLTLGIPILLAGSLGIGAAQADPILESNSIRFKYTNYEILLDDLVDADGNFTLPADGTNLADGSDDLRGILLVTQYFQPAGSASADYNDGDNGDHLWGIFYGLELNEVETTGSGFNLNYVSGYIDIYLGNSTFDPLDTGSGGTSGDYSTLTGLIDDGELWLSLQFDSGIIPGDPTTLAANVNSDTAPFNGSGISFLSVATTPGGTGSQNQFFDTNAVVDSSGGIHDFSLSNVFRSPIDSNNNNIDDTLFVECIDNAAGQCVKFANDWDLFSEDPVIGSVQIPAPGTLLLMGGGLLGGLLARRRHR